MHFYLFHWCCTEQIAQLCKAHRRKPRLNCAILSHTSGPWLETMCKARGLPWMLCNNRKIMDAYTNTQTCTCFISITVRQKTTCHRLPPRVATRSLYSVRLGCCCTHYMQHNDNHHCLVPRVDPMMSLTKLSRQF